MARSVLRVKLYGTDFCAIDEYLALTVLYSRGKGGLACFNFTVKNGMLKRYMLTPIYVPLSRTNPVPPPTFFAPFPFDPP